MTRSTRRRFLRSVVGGVIAMPAIIKAQVLSGPQQGASMPADTLRHQDATLTVPHPMPRPSERKRKHPEPPKALTLLKPRKLSEGSVIALVAPASGVTNAEVQEAEASMKSLGFKVKIGDYLTKDYGYLAAHDDQRAAEFMKFVHDPEVDCIMAVRGGYGVMRILPLLDFAAIRANPKVIVGYSDLTALVNPIYQNAGLMAFHGPVATSTFDKYTLDSFRRIVMSAAPAGEFAESDEFHGASFGDARATTIVPGKAQGRLVGGNLSLVTALMGTRFEIETAGKILFLEEVEEEPYRIDRMLMQLALGGKLQACAGVALGRFNKCEASSKEGSFRLSLTLEDVIRGILEPLKIPTVYGLAIGHIKSKITMPVGALATLDADAKTVSIDEPAVRE